MNVYKIKIGSSTVIHITATDLEDAVTKCNKHIKSEGMGCSPFNEVTGKKEFVYLEIKSIEMVARLTDIK